MLNTKLHTSFFPWLDPTLHFSRHLQLDFQSYTKLPFFIHSLSQAGFQKQGGMSPSSRCSPRTFLHHKTEASARGYVNIILLKLHIWASQLWEAQGKKKAQLFLLCFLWPVADRLFKQTLFPQSVPRAVGSNTKGLEAGWCIPDRFYFPPSGKSHKQCWSSFTH